MGGEGEGGGGTMLSHSVTLTTLSPMHFLNHWLNIAVVSHTLLLPLSPLLPFPPLFHISFSLSLCSGLFLPHTAPKKQSKIKGLTEMICVVCQIESVLTEQNNHSCTNVNVLGRDVVGSSIQRDGGGDMEGAKFVFWKI